MHVKETIIFTFLLFAITIVIPYVYSFASICFSCVDTGNINLAKPHYSVPDQYYWYNRVQKQDVLAVSWL